MINHFPFTPNSGYEKTDPRQLVPGSCVILNGFTLLILLDSLCGQVALLHSLRLVPQWSSFSEPAFGPQMLSNAIFERT